MEQHANEPVAPPADKTVVVVGLGNIGSYFIAHLARMPGLARVVLVDMDRYEAKNVAQDILPEDVGQWKVDVQARRIRQLNTAVQVETHRQRVQDVPMGRLRSHVIVAGLDTRVARLWVNQVAWRLGVPWVDSGVDGAALQVRVNGFFPGTENACLECAWDKRDYDLLEQHYPCLGEGVGVGNVPTNAPSMVGAVAGGFLAVECRKVLLGDLEHFLHSRQVLLDMIHYAQHVTRFRRLRTCRFDHRTYHIEPSPRLADELTVEEAIRAVAGTDGECPRCSLRLEGHSFARHMYCANCDAVSGDFLMVARRVSEAEKRCPQCGTTRDIRGADRVGSLRWAQLRPEDRQRTLHSAGLQPGDVYTVSGPGGSRHFELR